MSTDSEQRSPIFRFLETFFQEQNIKWMLGVGMLILIGSSLMLVTSHWADYTPLWKSTILLGYTLGVHVAGQVSFHSLGLRKTGTVLMALTVLLIPLGFHALNWNYRDGFGQQTASLILLAGNGVLATLAAGRVFRHFLRSSQPTFLVSYAILCVAATVLPLASSAVAPWLALGLWAVFAVGAVKVNRHVFWLTEEHRLPRVCGFFPILLLGGQFLTLFATSLGGSTTQLIDAISVEWLGFGLVLTAVPILLTVDSLARVFLEINGQLTRPFPWSLVIPMLTGLGLVATGVCVSAIGFPDAVALVPASALAAVIMAIIARRTGNSAFVWMMLAGILMAYQCSPVFFREFASQVVQHGASAVRESRLPFAFYGLTYFPLLVMLSIVAKWRQRLGDTLFAIPMQRFAIGLGTVLLGVSLTHAKAVFPVSLATVALFTMQGMLFRDRRVAVLGIVAWLVATLSCSSFLTDVLLVQVSAEVAWLIPCLGVVFLLFPGSLIDRRVAEWSSPDTDTRWGKIASKAIFESASRWATVVLAAAWFGGSLFALPEIASVSGVLLAIALFVHAVRVQKLWSAELTLSFGVAFAVLQALAMEATDATVTSLASICLFAMWSVLPRIQIRKLAFFREAGPRVAVAGFLLLIGGVLLPAWVGTVANGQGFTLWIATVLATFWTFGAAGKYQSPWLAILCWIAVLADSSVVAVELVGLQMAREWLPAIWGTVSVVTIFACQARNRILCNAQAVNPGLSIRADNQFILRMVHHCTLVTLGLLATGSLLFFSLPIRIAGGIALVGLLQIASQRRQPTMRTVALMLVNWQVLCAVIQVFIPSATDIFELTFRTFAQAAAPVALLASLLLVSWQYGLSALHKKAISSSLFQQSSDTSELIGLQRALLQVLAAGSLVAVAFASTFDGLTWYAAAMVVATFLVLAADCLIVAFRIADSAGTVPGSDDNGDDLDGNLRNALAGAQGRVWAAQAILATGVLHLVLCGVITVGNGFSMFAVLGTGLLAWSLSHWFDRYPRTNFLAAPLLVTGQCLPAVAVAIGIGRHFFSPDSSWLGMNSLALLLAAGFYFWRGLERRNSALLTGAAVIVNIALALLWNELQWTDPQFFMIPLGISLLGLVELLRSEIPANALNPLRYAAALVILVSPTFHIVGGSWLHLFSLMVASVGVTLVAMGLRIRALMYTGVGFLVADVIAMLVRGSIDNPSILWIAGITFGTLVIGLAAYCERHREKLLQRMRIVASQLEAWE